MKKNNLINKIKSVYSLCEESWSDCEIFDFEDKNINKEFLYWLKDNYKSFYKNLNNILGPKQIEEDFTIIDFFECLLDRSEDELIEIFVDFLYDSDDLVDELLTNIENFKEDFGNDDYEDFDDDDLKEDRYDDYDFYDDY